MDPIFGYIGLTSVIPQIDNPPDNFGGDMQNMPEGKIPNGEMPDFGNIEIPSDENVNTADNETVPANEGNGVSNPHDFFGENAEMPEFNNVGAPQKENPENNSSEYILLCVSAVLLVGGLMFAFKFKR